MASLMTATRALPARAALLLAIALAALAVNAGAASATTAAIVPDSPNTLVITGDPGNNNIEVYLQPNLVSVKVEDGDAPVTPLAGCSPGDSANAAICTVWEVNAIRVDTGAGDDRFYSYTADTVNNAPFDPFGTYEITGGDGDDRLYGGSGTYSGGDGSDQMYGSGTFDAGADDIDDYIGIEGSPSIVHTGPGDDYVYQDGPPGNDLMDLGSGTDTVTYGGRTAKIRGDLRTGVAGEKKEHDTMIGVENLTGGNNNDILYGNDVDNRLLGLDGSDKLFAFGGNDTLEAGLGKRDLLDGGFGDDLFHARDGETVGSDTIKCKQGLDSYQKDPKDHVTKDCETALP